MTRLRAWWAKHGLKDHPIIYALFGLLVAIWGGGWATWLGGWAALLGVVAGAFGTLAGIALCEAVYDALTPSEGTE